MRVPPQTTTLTRLALLGSCLALLAPGSLLADSGDLLEEGRRLYEEEVDFEGALAVYQSILADEGAPAEHVELAQIQAAFCLVALDRMEEAIELMAQAILARPEYELPPYSSPKLVEAVAEARTEATRRREQLEEEERTRAALAAAFVQDPPPPAVGAPSRALRLWQLSAAVGGGAVLAFGVGGFYGISAGKAEDRLINDRSSFDSHRDALDFRAAAISQARTANVLFVSGAVLAAGAGTLLFLDQRETTMVAAPLPGGMVLAASRRF